MICRVKGCNKDTEFDIDYLCNYHWKNRNEEKIYYYIRR